MDAKIKQRLDAVADELKSIPQLDLDLFRKLWTRHSYAVHLAAYHDARNLLLPGSGTCSKTDLIVLAGCDSTEDSGKMTLSIDSLLCGTRFDGLESLSERFELIREPTFVATCHGSAPTFVTSQIRSTRQPAPYPYILVDRDGNVLDERPLKQVLIDVLTWKHDGTLAGTIGFSWVCMVEVVKAISIGG